MPDRDPRGEALRRGGLSNTRRFILRPPARQGKAALETRETAQMTEVGFEELSETLLHCCQTCNGAIHKLEELGGFCVRCKLTLCKECAGTRCWWQRCRKCVCSAHAVVIGDKTYCVSHGIMFGVSWGIWVLLVGGIAAVAFFG